MKNKFLLTFCSAAILTVMNANYAFSLPSAPKGRSQVGDRKIVRAGQLCQGKLIGGTYANYIGRYSSEYQVDGLPALTIYFGGIIKELSEGDAGIADIILVNGRNISVDDHASVGAVGIRSYRVKGRVYRIKSGDRVKAVFSHAGGLKDTIECTIPYKW